MSIQWKVEKRCSCNSDQAVLNDLFSLLFEQKCGQQWFLSYFTTSLYPLPEEFSFLFAHLLLLPPVWWVLTETCCLGSSIMHPLPRDIMCDKWPISVQTPIGPWPGGVGVRASVRKSLYVCLFVYESKIAVHVRKWDDEGSLCFVSNYFSLMSMSGEVVLMWVLLQQQSLSLLCSP